MAIQRLMERLGKICLFGNWNFRAIFFKDEGSRLIVWSLFSFFFVLRA